ncbi:MAG: LysM peptidoglycan-binding domain-containing protein [Chloroflexi bacterium]|nr:LysM peptidoglycan-binding domain-containing protein [Chloroflexota bacterium]
MRKKRILYMALAICLLAAMLIGPAAASAAAETEFLTHKVKYGETLWWIAWRYGVKIQEIVDANGLKNRNVIYPGQVLTIPKEKVDYFEYVVESGDTLLELAHRFGVKVWDIARLNGIWNTNLIFVGDKLLIPGGGEGAEPTDGGQPSAGAPTQQEAIIISSPAMGEAVSTPVTVTGWGSGFENNLAVDVLDATGAVIGQGYVIVDAEVGQYGPYTGTVAFTPPASAQMGRISVYSISPRDGAIEHLASVTVNLQP